MTVLDDEFPGDSAMSASMRAHDWSSTPLGSPETWPEGLKVPLRMMLTSRFEMWLGWGEDLAFFYNDAYAPTLGIKHPEALGRPMREVWREVFDAVADRITSVMRDGVPTWDKALMLLLERSGYPEETYHTFSYSPLRGDSGSIEGLMCVVSEETGRVISERRLETLRTLSMALVPARTRDDAIRAIRSALDSNRQDFPFSVLHISGEDPVGDGLSDAPWPFEQLRPGAGHLLIDLDGIVAGPPRGPWDTPPRDALLLPIMTTGQTPIGALVLGLNPYRNRDEDIAGFAELLTAQISAALAVVDAHLAEAAETERIRQLFQQSPSFITVLRGPLHRFELVNPGYMQLIGHRDVVGREVREALPEIVEQGFVALLDTVYTSGESYRGYSMRVSLQRTPDAEQEERFVNFVYQPIRSAAGAITGVFVEGVDVTDAHQAGLALRESEAQFRTLAEAMRNHVWTSRPDGYLDWFNTRVYEYSGAKPGELDGPNWAAIVHPDDLQMAASRWSQSLSSGNDYEAEFRLRDAGGSYRWHITRAVAQRDEDGSITRWIGTNTDIEDQKATAQALADLNATLEEQVVHRTGQLMAAQEALRQSQKMEAVGQLTGGIAHDFNNLLAGISASLEMIETRIAQGRLDAVPRYVDAAQGSAKRAAALTQRLLAFSRQQTLDPKLTNVNRLVEGMTELVRSTVGPSVEIEVKGAQDVWTTLVDPNQLENVLLNLAINGRDAMPEGGRLGIDTGNVSLSAREAKEQDLPPGDYVTLCVRDSGTGMTPEVISRAFDPFYTTKPLGQGTGLGLSMAYGFVRQSGGQIRIDSEIGKGTVICLYLPRGIGEEDMSQGRPADLDGKAEGKGETILVVDDEVIVRMLVVDVLEDAGYAVEEAGDGASAIAVLKTERRIDLLVTDVGLPGGMNGRQLADAAREMRPGLKVLFVTGYAEIAITDIGILDDSVQVLTKPFAVETLASKVAQMLSGRPH